MTCQRLCIPMTTIKKVQPVNAEKLFDLLKTSFADYINAKLDSNLSIEFVHVYDEINVLFPEVIDGPALNITITDDDFKVDVLATDSDYNTALLEKHLIDFLEIQAG